MSRPENEDLARRIEQLASREASRPGLEQFTRERQGDNPQFAFLAGGEGQEYYEVRTPFLILPNPSVLIL